MNEVIEALMKMLREEHGEPVTEDEVLEALPGIMENLRR